MPAEDASQLEIDAYYASISQAARLESLCLHRTKWRYMMPQMAHTKPLK